MEQKCTSDVPWAFGPQSINLHYSLTMFKIELPSSESWEDL